MCDVRPASSHTKHEATSDLLVGLNVSSLEQSLVSVSGLLRWLRGRCCATATGIMLGQEVTNVLGQMHVDAILRDLKLRAYKLFQALCELDLMPLTQCSPDVPKRVRIIREIQQDQVVNKMTYDQQSMCCLLDVDARCHCTGLKSKVQQRPPLVRVPDASTLPHTRYGVDCPTDCLIPRWHLDTLGIPSIRHGKVYLLILRQGRRRICILNVCSEEMLRQRNLFHCGISPNHGAEALSIVSRRSGDHESNLLCSDRWREYFSHVVLAESLNHYTVLPSGDLACGVRLYIKHVLRGDGLSCLRHRLELIGS
mmetsp:Transcript_1558/g.3892  ORF Transcript_1558/g.3892 Transcript_1558/m.3892 type:complete len:310 (+) Transcript_1558:445-1374(+)